MKACEFFYVADEARWRSGIDVTAERRLRESMTECSPGARPVISFRP